MKNALGNIKIFGCLERMKKQLQYLMQRLLSLETINFKGPSNFVAGYTIQLIM